VRALRANGHVTGFMGDGINDAAALHAADVGISVESAVDIAKQAADIVLLEKSLAVLEQGVIEGRRTFVNMLKYIHMTANSNFGSVLSVPLASAFLPLLPMLPIHLLVQNLPYDLSQTAIPCGNVDDESLRAAALGAARAAALHARLRTSEFAVRRADLRTDVDRLAGADRGDADAVPERLVRRGPAVADARRAHDPHARHPLRRQPAWHATDRDEPRRRRRAADSGKRPRPGTAPAATVRRALRLARGTAARLRAGGAGDEARVPRRARQPAPKPAASTREAEPTTPGCRSARR